MTGSRPDIDEETLAMEIAKQYSISLNDARQIARNGLRSFDSEGGRD